VPRQLRTLQYANFAHRGPEDEVALDQVVRALRIGQKAPREGAEVQGAAAPQSSAVGQEEVTLEPPQQLEPIKPQYWSLPYGEQEWVTIPAGEFWMGDDQGGADGRPAHRLFVPGFRMARVPITNAQYALYVQATGVKPPRHWEEDGRPPKERLNHPVVHVSWEEACGYCEWLSQVTGKRIRLPTEAEWEKAARGDMDKRSYPWGDKFDASKCNSEEAGLGGTSPVGAFPAGASPYGCLDMSGNVWQWVQDWYDERYYWQGATRNLQGPSSGEAKVVRGGSWSLFPGLARVSSRLRLVPGGRLGNVGFRCAQ
jgi:formylglycine-generating enzyme required for sulfatase activity